MVSLSLRPVIKRRSTPFLLAVFLASFAIAVSLYLGPDPLEQARLAARYTARATFPLFILTYSASALARLWPNSLTQSLMRNRFHWAMGFVLAMAIHVVVFSYFLFMPNNDETAGKIYFGTIGIAVIYGMALTPLRSAARLGRLVWTSRLHRIGMHFLWANYFLIYQFHIKDPRWGMSNLPLLLLCVAGLGLRIAAWTKTRVKRYQTTTATPNPSA